MLGYRLSSLIALSYDLCLFQCLILIQREFLSSLHLSPPPHIILYVAPALVQAFPWRQKQLFKIRLFRLWHSALHRMLTAALRQSLGINMSTAFVHCSTPHRALNPTVRQSFRINVYIILYKWII